MSFASNRAFGWRRGTKGIMVGLFDKKKLDCPFWRGPCKEHDCRLYVQILGKHPQTKEEISKSGCSFEFLPWLLVENSQMQRQTGAAVESFRNENASANNVAIKTLEALCQVAQLVPPDIRPQIVDKGNGGTT